MAPRADKGGMERRDEDISPYVKRVVLPSGKTIEVVLFNDSAGAEAGPVEVTFPTVEEEQDLQVCLTCDSDLVYPLAWEEAGSDSWYVTLRCPECETCRDGVFSQDTVDAFDEELDAGSEALTADLRRLARSNMAGEVDRFAAALAADAILPEDF